MKKAGNPLAKRSRTASLVSSQPFIAFVVMVLLYLLFFILSPNFRTINVFTQILDAAYYLGFLAIGVTFVIATGGIDLSLGTVMITSALIGGRLFTIHGLPIWVAIIATILIAVLFNIINGYLVAYLSLPAFIATLGVQMISTGFGQIWTERLNTTWPSTTGAEGGAFRMLFKVSVRTDAGIINIPTGLILLVIASIIMGVVLRKTRTGRYILALGSNYEATRLSGINVRKYMMLSYIINGFFVGIGAVAFAATYSAILPGTGTGQELNAIAGVVIGGTSLNGGIASIPGTIFGIMLMAILKVGLPKVGMQPEWQTLITGLIILAAVMLDIARNKKK